MELIAGFVLGAGAMGLAWRAAVARRAPSAETTPPAADAPQTAAGMADEAPTDATLTREAARDRILAIKREIEAKDDEINDPRQLAALPAFEEGIALLASPHFSAEDIVDHIADGGWALGAMAAAAARRRDDVSVDAVFAPTRRVMGYPLVYLLDWVQQRADAGDAPKVLLHAQDWWWGNTGPRKRLREYFASLRDRGLVIDAQSATLPQAEDEFQLVEQRTALASFEEPLLAGWIERLDRAIAHARERRVLGNFGRLRMQRGDGARLMHADLDLQARALFERMTGERPKSQLLVGAHGVGKSVLAQELADRLVDAGWSIFEASASDVLSNQTFIGELEGRVREMLGVLRRPKTAWLAGDLLDLLHKGAHSKDPRGILDLVLPAIERGELLVVGEVTTRQLAQLVLARPTIKHHFDVQALAPADAEALDALLRLWADAAHARAGTLAAQARTLAEAARMAAQFFPEQEEPGRTLRLLDEVFAVAMKQEPRALPFGADQVLEAVAARSGLPMRVIDDRQGLDLEGVRAAFHQRVLGQDEAVDSLVDRIAMLKAGLVDPGRPIGVFLFAGPTGTGKTELAKALGEMLFGSDERLLRLDMSEYQSEDATWRLLGDSSDGARSLTQRIREQPFSVVLLDEFEKAHPKVWDLFLQVFDDGRLSDRSGHVTDFRHTIIILTSNVGSTLSRSAGPGFTASRAAYSRSAVEKALFETFRREFLNRLDRIVLFQPLDRALMREILHKELRGVLERRGLRNRAWAVEWEPSAVEFLLDRGFTPDLGARPLRRAIEHHLLAPLARSIVEHRAPQGDQFLFVRSNGQTLDVEFVDPDAGPTATQANASPATDAVLREWIAEPADAAAMLPTLDGTLAAIALRIDAAAWTQARDADYARMSDTAFWDDAGRFAVLDRIERRDRIESALDTARRLLERCRDGHAPASLPGALAQLLFLLGLAVDDLAEGRPQDALLHVSVGQAERKRAGADARQWWQALLRMYMEWARKRNMRVDVLRQDAERCEAWLAVSGFGAYRLLEPEAGLHVREDTGDDGQTHRAQVHVRVTPEIPGKARVAPAAEDTPRVARRYRGGNAPLVRDTARGWRSGRIERVLEGDFDVMQ